MIKNKAEYNELAHAADMAEENLSSMRFGSHYMLIQKLKAKHGVVAKDSRDAIRKARQLCDEWLYAQGV